MLFIEFDPPYQEILDSGLLPYFLQFLKSTDETQQFESAWIITNLLSGTSEQTAAVLEYDVIIQLLELTNSTSVNVVEQAMWGLGNIAGDCKEYCDQVVEKGFLDAVTKVIDQYENAAGSKALLRTVAWALTSVFRPLNQSSLQSTERLLPYFERLLRNQCDLIRNDSCWAIVYLVETSQQHLELIVLNYPGIIETIASYIILTYPRHKPLLRVVISLLEYYPNSKDTHRLECCNCIHRLLYQSIFPALRFSCEQNNHRLLIQATLFPILLKVIYHRENTTSLGYKQQLQDLLLALCHEYTLGDSSSSLLTIVPEYTISWQYYLQSHQKQEYWRLFLVTELYRLAKEWPDFPLEECLLILLNQRLL